MLFRSAVDYLIHAARPDGIISTRLPLLRFAKAKGLRTILRFFLIDSIAMENIAKMKNERCVDLIEVLPGLMPKVIHRVAATCGKPIIAGGLVTEKADVVSALEAGALAVSSTNPGVWQM